MTVERSADELSTADSVRGARGSRTRRRLVAEVERRCLVRHHSTITVAEISAAASTSTATFYYYFPDVATAVAEAAANNLAAFDEILSLADEVVDRNADLRSCRQLVSGFFDFWQTRPGLLDTIVVASTTEDSRVFRVLLRTTEALTDALVPAVRGEPKRAVAGSVVMMLALSAARRSGFERDGITQDDLEAAQARIIRSALRR